jgi:hypothetical protein
MDEGSGRNWRDILWQLLKPALVAAIVALLVALGVVGLRQPALPAGGAVGVASAGTHFTGPVFVSGALNVTGAITASTIVSSSNGFVSTNGFDVAGNITMTDGGIINSKGAVTVTDSLRVTGAGYVVGVSTLAGGVSTTAIDATTVVTVGTWLKMPAQAGLVVSGWITPTGSMQPISSVAWVTPTLNVSTGVAGYILRLENTGGYNICLLDSSTVQLAGDWLGSLYDMITLYHDGSRWLELSRCDN